MTFFLPGKSGGGTGCDPFDMGELARAAAVTFGRCWFGWAGMNRPDRLYLGGNGGGGARGKPGWGNGMSDPTLAVRDQGMWPGVFPAPGWPDRNVAHYLLTLFCGG